MDSQPPEDSITSLPNKQSRRGPSALLFSPSPRVLHTLCSVIQKLHNASELHLINLFSLPPSLDSGSETSIKLSDANQRAGYLSIGPAFTDNPGFSRTTTHKHALATAWTTRRGLGGLYTSVDTSFASHDPSISHLPSPDLLLSAYVQHRVRRLLRVQSQSGQRRAHERRRLHPTSDAL